MAKPLTAESILTDIQRTAVYFRVVIRSFRSGETERLFRREPVPRFKAIEALREIAPKGLLPDGRQLTLVFRAFSLEERTRRLVRVIKIPTAGRRPGCQLCYRRLRVAANGFLRFGASSARRFLLDGLFEGKATIAKTEMNFANRKAIAVLVQR